MNTRRIVGIVIAVAGIVLVLTSKYITGKVAEGKGEIYAGQNKVDSANSVFGLTPQTKEIGKGFTESGQRRIDEGWAEVGYYESLASKLKIGGYILLVIGAVVVMLPNRNPNRRK